MDPIADNIFTIFFKIYIKNNLYTILIHILIITPIYKGRQQVIILDNPNATEMSKLFLEYSTAVADIFVWRPPGILPLVSLYGILTYNL